MESEWATDGTTGRNIICSREGQEIICPWKPPDKIWNPPSLLFSSYHGGGWLGAEDLSLGRESVHAS